MAQVGNMLFDTLVYLLFIYHTMKGRAWWTVTYSTPVTYFGRLFCIFSKHKATLDKVSNGSSQKCFKELKNYSFTSVETIIVKLQ